MGILSKGRFPAVQDVWSSEQMNAFRSDYLSGKFTREVLASMHGISVPSVYRLSRRLGLPPRPTSMKDKNDKAIRAFYREGLTTYEIGQKLGIHDETVRHRLEAMGIPRRKPSEKNVLRNYYRFKHLNQKPYLTPTGINNFIRLAYDHNTLGEMAKKLEVDRNTIRRRMKAMGLKPSRMPEKRYRALMAAKDFYEHNVTQDLFDVSKRFGIDDRTLSRFLKKKGVPIRSIAYYVRIRRMGI